jgi:hypothetical protein
MKAVTMKMPDEKIFIRFSLLATLLHNSKNQNESSAERFLPIAFAVKKV